MLESSITGKSQPLCPVCLALHGNRLTAVWNHWSDPAGYTCVLWSGNVAHFKSLFLRRKMRWISVMVLYVNFIENIYWNLDSSIIFLLKGKKCKFCGLKCVIFFTLEEFILGLLDGFWNLDKKHSISSVVLHFLFCLNFPSTVFAAASFSFTM